MSEPFGIAAYVARLVEAGGPEYARRQASHAYALNHKGLTVQGRDKLIAELAKHGVTLDDRTNHIPDASYLAYNVIERERYLREEWDEWDTNDTIARNRRREAEMRDIIRRTYDPS